MANRMNKKKHTLSLSLILLLVQTDLLIDCIKVYLINLLQQYEATIVIKFPPSEDSLAV